MGEFSKYLLGEAGTSTPAPTKGQFVDYLLGDPDRKQDLGLQVPSAIRAVQNAAPALAMQNVTDAYQIAGSLPGGGAARAVEEVKRYADQLKPVRKGVSKLIGQAAVHGTPDDLAKVTELAQDIYTKSPAAQKAVSVGQRALDFVDPVKPIAKGVFRVLDKAHEYAVRQNTMPGVPNLAERLVTGQPIQEISDQEWNKAIDRQYAEAKPGSGKTQVQVGPVKIRGGSSVTDALVSAGDIVGGVAGLIPGAAYGGLLAAADARKGRPVEEGQWSRALGKGSEFGQHLTRTIASDPLNLVTMGSGSVTKNAVAAMTRVGERAGLKGAALANFAGDVERVMKIAGGTSDQAEAVLSVAAKAGIPEAAVKEALGSKLEYLGRGQLQLGPVPLAAVTGTEYPLAKGIDKAAAKLGATKSLFDPTKTQAKNVARQARAVQAMVAESNLEGLDDVARAIKPIGLNRYQELLERHLDPAFSLVGENAVPRPDYIAREMMTDAERGAMDATTAWLSRVEDRLKSRGALDPKKNAANALSQRFFPRRYQHEAGWLDEAVSQKHKGISAPREEAGLDLPLGEAKARGAKQKFSGAETLQQYARQAARTEGQAYLEQELVGRFGRPLAEGEKVSGLKAALKEVTLDGKRYEVPAVVANVMEGTFDSTYRSLSSALRSSSLANLPAVRVALRGLDAYEKVISAWKHGILRATPGYHVVNTMNDFMQAAGDGMNNIPGWMAKAVLAMKNPNRTLKVAGVEMSGQQLLGLARREGLSLDLAERAGVDAPGIGKTWRQFKGVAEPTKKNRALRAWERFNPAQKVEQVLQEPIRFAHFLWALEKGDAPREAAARTMKVFLDYGDKNQALQIARWFLPFATYTFKAPGMAVRMMANRPGRIMSMDRALRGVGENDLEAKRYVGQRGEYVTLGDEPSQALADIFGWEQTPGYRTAFDTRNPFVEAFQLPVQIARSLQEFKPAPLVGQMGPVSKALAETMSGQDLVNPGGEGFSGVSMRPLPYGTTGTWLDAGAGDISAPSRYAAPLLPGLNQPAIQLLVNEYLRRNYGTPATVVGASRLYSTSPDPGSQTARQVANLLTRMRPTEVSPIDFLFNAANDPALPSAKKAITNLKRGQDRTYQPLPSWR